MRLHFTGTTFPPHHGGKTATPEATWAGAPTPGLQPPRSPTGRGRPEVEFPTSSFATSRARATSTSLRPTRLLSDLNPLFTHHTHADTVLPDTGRAKDQGEGELVRARRGTDAPPSRPARHPPAGREPGGGGAGAPSSPKTSLKSSSSWAPQFAVVIGVAQGAVAPQAAIATGGSYSGNSSSAPLHAGSRQPEGSGSATNFPGGDCDAERSVPNFRAGSAPKCTRSCRHCQPKPPQSP